ncbi:MAG: Ty1/Copia family ribonuclease HI [Spongiibacteraceae bacterium]|nr:Ty1/Copia family ribonuclease HI [Spongiibacteraceae bacterium]
MYIAIHVDDGLFFCTDEKFFEICIEEIKKHLTNVTMVRPLKKFVGIHMDHDREAGFIQCCQSTFIEDLQSTGKAEKLPMCPSYNLRKEPSNPENESLLPVTGKLRYVCDRTRWDVLVATGEIACGGAQDPSDAHVRTAEKTVNYLRSTNDEYLKLDGVGELELFAFSDASYIAEGKSKSRIGGCLFLSLLAGAFYCFSKNALLVAQSSTHSELQALDEVLRIVIHCRSVLEFLKCGMLKPTKIYIDNKSAKELCEVLKSSYKTSSSNMRINFIRECINNKIIELHFVPTQSNVADLLTKPLAYEPFCEHRSKVLYGFSDKHSLDEVSNMVFDFESLSEIIVDRLH